MVTRRWSQTGQLDFDQASGCWLVPMPDSLLALDFPEPDGWSPPVRLRVVEDEDGEPVRIEVRPA